MSRASLLLALTGLVGLLAGCDPDAPGTKPGGDTDDSGAPAPTWDGVAVGTSWHRAGLGEAWDLAAADLDGDGSEEVLYGGRTVAALDAASRATHAPRWTLDWVQTERDVDGADNTWATDLATFDATGDGVLDLLVVGVDNDAHLVDGATGEPVWSRTLETDLFTMRFALFDGDADGVPDFFASGGSAAYSGATGETLWSHTFPTWPLVPMTAEVDGLDGRDLIVAREIDQIVVGTGDEPFAALEEGEPEVAVYAFDGAGTLVWEYAPAALVTWAAAADLDGDALDEVYLGHDGTLTAAGADGLRWELAVEGPVTDMATVDVDADGVEDVVAVVLGFDRSDRVVAVSSAGEELWSLDVEGSVEVLDAVDVDGDGTRELVVGGGRDDGEPIVGWTHVVDPAIDAPARVRWSADTAAPTSAIVPAVVDGTRVVLAGTRDGRLHAYDVAGGAEAWDYTAGLWVFGLAAADLDGDGVDDVVHGDSGGNLVRTSLADGSEAWSRTIETGGMGMVVGVAAGDLDHDGVGDVVATGLRYGQADSGVVARYDADGVEVFSATMPEWPETPQLADVDGDGVQEIVFAFVGGVGCGVRAIDGAGATVWETVVVPSCMAAYAHVGDADGDGRPEIGFSELDIYAPLAVALLEADGAVRWQEDVITESGYWVRVVDGGLLTGGYATDFRGMVTMREAADGTMRWMHLVDPIPDPDAEGMVVSAGSLFAAELPDLDGDGVADLATGTEIGDVRALSMATGEALWVTRLEDEGLPYYDRHIGGPMAWIPATDTVPAYLAVGQYDFDRSQAKAFALDAEGGIRGSVPLRGEAHGLVGVTYGDGATGFVTTGGIGLYGVEAVKE